MHTFFCHLRLRAPLLELAAVAILLCSACDRGTRPPDSGTAAAPEPRRVVVYADLDATALQPVLDRFTAATGTPVYLVTGEFAALPGTLHGSGREPAADLLIAGSGSDLRRAVEENLLRPANSAAIVAGVAPQFRDPEGRWTGLATDPRLVVYHRDIVSAAEIATISGYPSLADEAWRGKLCLASSATGGNTLLIAWLIDELGSREAELVVRGWRSNLGIAVRSNDTALLDALEARQCGIGIAGSGALARHRERNPDSRLAAYRFGAPGSMLEDAVGAGVTRHAGNPDGAAQLLDWLLLPDANAALAAAVRLAPAAGGPVTDAAQLAGLGFLLEDAAQARRAGALSLISPRFAGSGS